MARQLAAMGLVGALVGICLIGTEVGFAAHAIASNGGDTTLTPLFVTSLAWSALRAIIFVAVMSMTATAVTFLFRSAIVPILCAGAWFFFVEPILTATLDSKPALMFLTRFFPIPSISAWLQGKHVISTFNCPLDRPTCQEIKYVLTAWDGGVVIAVIATALILVSAWSFRRRDI